MELKRKIGQIGVWISDDQQFNALHGLKPYLSVARVVKVVERDSQGKEMVYVKWITPVSSFKKQSIDGGWYSTRFHWTDKFYKGKSNEITV